MIIPLHRHFSSHWLQLSRFPCVRLRPQSSDLITLASVVNIPCVCILRDHRLRLSRFLACVGVLIAQSSSHWLRLWMFLASGILQDHRLRLWIHNEPKRKKDGIKKTIRKAATVRNKRWCRDKRNAVKVKIYFSINIWSAKCCKLKLGERPLLCALSVSPKKQPSLWQTSKSACSSLKKCETPHALQRRTLSGPQRNNFELGDLIKSEKLEKGKRNLGIKARKYICHQATSLTTPT